MKLLVTGAAGHIGTRFLMEYADRYDLRMTDLREPKPEYKTAGDWRFGDLTDREFSAGVCEGIDCILHLAGNPNWKSPWEVLYPSNVASTQNIFHSAHEAGVKRIVFASTIQVVEGYPEEVCITPDMPPFPMNEYAATKALGELLCSVYSHKDMSCLAIRIGAYTVPKWMKPHTGEIWRKKIITPSDMNQLLRLAIEAPDDLKFGIFHGVSNNYKKRLDITSTCQILGYAPQDVIGPPEEAPPVPEGQRASIW